MWKSSNYWVRLSSLKVIGVLLEQKSNLVDLAAESGLKFAYRALSVFNFVYITEEVADQTVTNLNHISSNILSQQPTNIVKVLKKGSYIGRKLLVSPTPTPTPTPTPNLVIFYRETNKNQRKPSWLRWSEYSLTFVSNLRSQTYWVRLVPLCSS
jgi:hypothetical protein